MKLMLFHIQMFFKRLLAHLPHKLPQGMTEFEAWATDIIQMYDMPDNDSIRFALAVSILHLPATAAFKPKAYFGYVLIKGAASEISGAIMQDLKEKQKKAAAVTTPSQPESDVHGETPQAKG